MLTSEFGTGDPVDTHLPTSARLSSLVHSRQGKIPAVKRALAGFAAWALLGAAATATPDLVHRWSFNDGTANDSVGTANGTLFGNTTPAITGGKLVLNPGSDQNQYMKTSAFTGETLGARTLVAWVALSNLDQEGGAGVLGIHPDGVDNFDSIVYGERVAKQWMNGSNGFNRTVANNGGAAETSTGELMMAIVYGSDNSIKLYRNGVRYDTSANAGVLVTRTAPIAILGRRQENSPPELQGAINEARIYDYALTAGEIQELNTLGPDILPGGAGIDITASAGTGGSISPAGVRVVPLNSTPTFTIIPAIGYNVADVVLDGTTSLGPVTTYTFPAVTAARTINASFVAVSPHTITASAGTNGSISPTGAGSVAHRDSQTFTITPNNGYVVADVVLDAGTGSETHLGPVTTYTFANVQTDHTISATFFAGSLVHRWSFNDSTANDSVGTANGTLFGNTTPAITGGKLVLNPGSDQNQYMKTSAFTGETLGVRTLVAWVAVSNLNQEGGAGVLGIHPAGVDHFDSIVYGERVAKQWMNGSNFFARTVANNGGAAETSTSEVMMAIVYGSDNSIKLYRNGVRYDTNANQGTMQTRTAPIAILGRRQENSPPELQGAINEARIYDYALTDVEIQELNTLGPEILKLVTVTSPASNQAYPTGTSVTAVASVATGASTGPYSVQFYKKVGAGSFAAEGSPVTGAGPTFSLSLGALADQTYQIYATVTDSVSATASSATNTFTVAPAVSLTAPANAEGFISGTSVIAAASVLNPGDFLPHTVRFHVTPTSPAGPTVVTNSPGTSSPYTADLGTLAVGTYQIYATFANSADPVQTGTSATRTFTVDSSATWAHSGSLFIDTTANGANVSGAVSNFPLLVRFNSNNFNFAQAASDGRDIRFSTAAGTALSYEIEHWDPAGGKAAVWVKIPTITGNATQEIKMYWGKSGVLNQSNGSSVFNSTNGYCSVMHLNGNVLDSTGAISPVNNGATPSTAAIGGTAMNLAAGDITAGNITNFPTGTNPASSGQLWFRPRKADVWGFPLAWGQQNAYGWNTWQMQIGFWGGPSVLPAPLTCRGPATVSGSTALAANQWYHVVYTNTNGTGRLYVNGVLDGTASGGSFAIANPQGLTLARADGDVDEARISNVTRSADWVKLEYENQKPLQTLVGGIVPSGSAFSVTPTSATMNELATTTLTAQAGGARKVYWIYKKGAQETVLATDQLTFNYNVGRITGNDSAIIRFKAVFAVGTQTIDVPLTVLDTVPDPVFTLVPSTTSWDGRTTMTVTANITNLAAMQAAGFGTLNYKWNVSGVAVTKQTSGGTLTLTRSQGSGPMTVSLTIDNGGTPVSNNTIITVQEPASDPWVERTPGATEKPVSGQFFARNPNTGLGTIFYNGTQTGATDVYLKVYTTDTGSDVLYATHRQALSGTNYAFTAPIAAGKFIYKVAYGTTTGGNDSAPLATVTDLVCGDAFIIEGQSNALATDNSAPSDTATTNKWIRTYGLTTGWGYAISKGNDRELGLWGWYLANRLVTNNSMPVFIINGAVGGTRIDVHRPNPANHSLPFGSGYGENSYANLYNRVTNAKLNHGIRGLFWHQGEQDQGAEGPDGDYDYKFYQQYFVDISAAWKQDFPNLRNYYLYQIWPAACGDPSRNDQLREVQRTLPYLYSNMKIMSTHGIVPGSGCHYEPLGYQVFSDLIGPLVEQDVYGVNPTAKLTAPNLQRANFTTPAKNEIALVFDQNVAWNVNAPIMMFLANSAGATSGSVSSGSASGNTIKLQVSGATSAATITYLKGLFPWQQADILKGNNGIAALTFADVPIGTLSPYEIWAGGSFANAFTDKASTSDPDGDGMTNQEEFAFDLDPTSGSSVNPITQQLDKATGIFKYKRTKDSGLTYKVYYSTNLSGWTLDAAATQAPAAAVAGVETVTVTLAAAVPLNGKLFVRVEATPVP